MAILQKLALISVPWDEEESNTYFFETTADQRGYFDSLTSGLFSPLLNFNARDNVETVVPYRDNSGRGVNELLSCNYCVVQYYDTSSGLEVELEEERRYYFAHPQLDSSNQLMISLSLDDIQTNYIRYRENLGECNIDRAHLNRFEEVSTSIVRFRGGKDSPLFLRETGAVQTKVVTKRTRLKYLLGNDTVNDWVDNNVFGWYYIYPAYRDEGYQILNPTATGTSYQSVELPNTQQVPFGAGQGSGVWTQLNLVSPILCYPLKNPYAAGDIVVRQGGYSCTISPTGFNYFKSNNENTSYIYNIKFSLMPPFMNASSGVIENNNLILDGGTSSPSGNFYNGSGTSRAIATANLSSSQATSKYGLFSLQNMSNYINFDDYTIDATFQFSKSEIINSDKDPKFNPKLLGKNYKELRITNGAGDSFVYDVQMLNKNVVNFTYSEALTPDITRGYLRIWNPDDDGIYAHTDENLTGLVFSVDNSMLFDNDQLSETLAQNKNFYLQQTADVVATGLTTALMAFLGVALAGVTAGASLAIAGGLLGIAGAAANNAMTNENIENAPNSLKSANGNVNFNMTYTKPGFYVEEMDILDSDKIALNDAMCQNGFVYNKIDYPYNFDNIRKYYNFLQCSNVTVNAPMNNEEKRRLANKLRSGVRFWNTYYTDVFMDYSKENYEKWLEE